MQLYSRPDEAAMTAAIPRLMAEAAELRLARVAPTADQRREVAAVVWDLVRRRGRKVYGGHALNAALLRAAPDEAIYGREAAGNHDIEFYSPDPVADVYELCDRLFGAGHRFVQGKEAAHHGTFTVSVEFTRMCDITYVPQYVFDRLPCAGLVADTNVANIAAVEPQFALIDHMRILCDPFTSHWKLDRMLPRMMLIQRLFPLGLPRPSRSEDDEEEEGEEEGRTRALRSILEWAALRRTMALVGEGAARFYAAYAASGASGACWRVPARLTLVSTNYAEDLSALASILGVDEEEEDQDDEEEADDAEVPAPAAEETLLYEGNAAEVDDALDALIDAHPDAQMPEHVHTRWSDASILVERPPAAAIMVERYPLIDLVGASARFEAHGKTFALTLIDARGKTVPVAARSGAAAGGGIPVASVTYCVMTELALRFAAGVAKRADEAAGCALTAARLVETRSAALAALSKTVADDDTVFRDVRLEHLGEPLSDMRVHMAAADLRRLRGGPGATAWFSYDPLRPGRFDRGRARSQHYALIRCDGATVADPVDSVLAQHRATRALVRRLDISFRDGGKPPPEKK